MLGGKSWDVWIEQYGHSHTHPFNRLCHTLGIPLIALSLPLFVVALLVAGFWWIPLTMFVVGWVFQFLGHAVEGKPPEFLKTGDSCSSACGGGSRRSVAARNDTDGLHRA
jgi:uncharacterized membrane protein YGL010W